MKLFRENKWIKQFLVVLTFIWLFILSIIIISAYRFNPNEHKDFITHKFFTATGRTLILNGPIELNIFPTVRLTVKNFIITNPPKLDGGNFIEANSLNAEIAILPLIKGTLNFNQLTLDGVQLNFIHNQYINNWNFKPTSKNRQDTNINLVINKLLLKNAKVNYVNLADKEQINTVQKFNLRLNEKGGTIKLDNKYISFKKATISINDDLQAEVNGKIIFNPELSYAGELAINKFSALAIIKILDIKIPSMFNTHTPTNITLNSKIEGNAEKLMLNKLNVTVGKALVLGHIDMGFKPYKISQNLLVKNADIADFINLKGFKLKFESAILSGDLSTNDSRLSSLNGEETLNIRQMVLYGLDIRRFNEQVNKAINDISTLRRLFTYTKTTATVKSLKEAIDKIQGQKKKSYSDVTNLGNFSAYGVAKHGNFLLSKCNLKGHDVVGDCSGYINFNSRTLNILAQGRLLPKQETSVVNYIYLPYTIKGRFEAPKYGLEWGYIAQEITTYYDFKNKK